MKLQWASNFDDIGNALGYTTHQKNLKKALENAGVEITDDAKVAVTIITPECFIPVPDKFNILYTMYECTSIPDHWIKPLQTADMLVVPCTHNKKLFRRYYKGPIEVCWEGVDVEKFTYKERKKNNPFIFLWVGASNPRKGYEHVVESWRRFTAKHPMWPCILYMKTTQKTRPERFEQVGPDAYIDTRLLPLEKEEEANVNIPSLIELYHMANAFLLPSMGEGFGLTLAEAMATGLPCIYTPWSGPVDFCSHKEGYPVKWEFTKVRTVGINQKGEPTGEIRSESKAASADPDSIVNEMERIILEYEYALSKGKKASERIRRDITWEKSAASFIKIVEKFTKEKL